MSDELTGTADDQPSVSALYWFPLIKAAGLPVPRTRFVSIASYLDLMNLFDGKEPKTWSDLCVRVDAAATEIREPCFLRTDIGSAKHSGPKAYKFPGAGGVRFQPKKLSLNDRNGIRVLHTLEHPRKSRRNNVTSIAKHAASIDVFRLSPHYGS